MPTVVPPYRSPKTALMTDSKPKYANFPERDLKVSIGQNISATTVKTLTRLSIGTYEMSFLQQEKAKATNDAARNALNALGKQAKLTLSAEQSREFVGVFVGVNAEVKYNLWVTTPFELTQANHIIWVRYTELTGEAPKTGVAFKLATAFSTDDVANLLKTAVKNAVPVPAGEPYVLKGNPPPRFQKKAAAADAPAEAEAEAAPAAEPASEA